MLTAVNASNLCIYTIHHIDALRGAFRRGGDTFTERKTWRTAEQYWRTQTEVGRWTPIFFAAADRLSGLLYVARLDHVEIKRTNIDYTEYTVSEMYQLSGKTPISALLLEDTGEPLSAQFQRPYAICRAPMEFYTL